VMLSDTAFALMTKATVASVPLERGASVS
jgi:hypothetical protein